MVEVEKDHAWIQNVSSFFIGVYFVSKNCRCFNIVVNNVKWTLEFNLDFSDRIAVVCKYQKNRRFTVKNSSIINIIKNRHVLL